MGWRWCLLAFLSAVPAILADMQTPTLPGAAVTDFVQRAGTQFVIATADANGTSLCRKFNFVGANAFSLMVRAADPLSRLDVLETLDLPEMGPHSALEILSANNEALRELHIFAARAVRLIAVAGAETNGKRKN